MLFLPNARHSPFATVLFVLTAAIPAVALACKPADVDAFYADAVAATQSLWIFAGILCGLICAIAIYRRKVSKSVMLALVATVFFPAWTLPPSPFGFGCAALDITGAWAVLTGLSVLLVRAIWGLRQSG